MTTHLDDNELITDLRATLEKGISDETMKKLRKQVEEITAYVDDDIMYRLKDDLSYNLSCYVKEMAARAIESMLDGNEEMVRRFLTCVNGGYTGRSDGPYCTRDIKFQHSVIHGKLSEHGGIALRHKLVDTYADLLKSQRILDLEDQVKSLVAQINDLNSTLDARNRTIRDYRMNDGN